MIIITKKVIPAETTRKVTPAEDMKRVIPVAAVVADVAQNLRSQDQMLEKHAALITEEPSMMEHSLILPMTVDSHWNSSVEQDR